MWCPTPGYTPPPNPVVVTWLELSKPESHYNKMFKMSLSSLCIVEQGSRLYLSSIVRSLDTRIPIWLRGNGDMRSLRGEAFHWVRGSNVQRKVTPSKTQVRPQSQHVAHTHTLHNIQRLCRNFRSNSGHSASVRSNNVYAYAQKCRDYSKTVVGQIPGWSDDIELQEWSYK